jgi:FKBP-type peptidyl-prolyl cis-trans isomerase 2
MTFNDGDFLKIEFDAKRVADGVLVYTTDEKKAKAAEIFREETKYEPQLAILGDAGHRNIISGLNENLRKMSVGESKRFELEPKDAFGERNPDLVKIMAISEFKKHDMTPYPGLQIDLDGIPAVVKSVNSGRVLVDANNPLAGEKVIYEVKVVSKIDGEAEKIKALSEYYNLNPEKVSVENNKAIIEYGVKLKKDANYFVNKSTFVSSTFKFIPKIENISIKEDYDKNYLSIKEEEAVRE